MSRLTVRLPGTLHDQLRTLAEWEGISLNQYIVYALTRQVTLAYTVQAVPEQAVSQQRASFTALLQNLGHASFDEIEAVLAEREVIEPEDGLDAKALGRLQERFAGVKPPS
jgi:hypothetical protein